MVLERGAPLAVVGPWEVGFGVWVFRGRVLGRGESGDRYVSAWSIGVQRGVEDLLGSWRRVRSISLLE